MSHPLDLLRHHVSGAIDRGEATAIIGHPALEPRDLARMSENDRDRFSDTPLAHIAAFIDFERDTRWSRQGGIN